MYIVFNGIKVFLCERFIFVLLDCDWKNIVFLWWYLVKKKLLVNIMKKVYKIIRCFYKLEGKRDGNWDNKIENMFFKKLIWLYFDVVIL